MTASESLILTVLEIQKNFDMLKNMVLDIRLFKSEDAREISPMIHRAVCIRDNAGYTQAQIESLASHYTPENFCKDLERKVIYVCTEENKVIGTATLRDDEIMAVFVEPEHQGRGIGTCLMDFLEHEALAKRIERVWLVAGLPAVKFYEKRGYEFVREKQHPSWGKGIVMSKCIRAL